MDWQKIIEKQKEIINKKINKGKALFDQGKFKEALSIFLGLAEEGLIRRSPQVMISVLINLGGIYLKLQDYEKSVGYYLEAFKKARTHPSLFQEKKEKIKREMAFALILKLAIIGKPENALKLCEFRLNKDPEEIFLIEVKGNLLNALGKYEDSVLCFEEILEKAKENMNKDGIFYKIGLNYFYLKDLNQAEEYFQKGKKENPRNHLNLLGLAQIAWEEKEWLTVIGFLEKAEKLVPAEVGFLPILIEGYYRSGLVKKTVPGVQKIIKSKNRIVITYFLNWLIKEVENMGLKEYLLKKTVQIGWKNPVFWEELRNVLHGSDGKNDSFLLDIFEKIKEEIENQPKKNSALVNLLKEIENLISKKQELIEGYFPLIGWLMPKEEIEGLSSQHLTEDIGNVLESVFVERFKTKYKITQGEEWFGFINKIKEEKGEVFSSLKEISAFLEGLENFDKNTVVTVVFDSRQKGGMTIEEQTNQLTFKILPDFPANLKSEELILLLDFYKKRRELWKNLVDLIIERKVVPPNWATVEQWAKKTADKLPVNQVLIEELNQEGNNLKMDLIFQKMEPEIYRRTYPIVSFLLKEKSPVLAARFNQKGGGNYSSLAIDYFKYIRREMKVKIKATK